MIEVVIASALIGLVAALMYGFMSGAASQYSNDQSRETLYQTARRFLDQVANELRDANPNAVLVTTSPASITFQRAKLWDTSVTPPVMTWTSDITYALTSSSVDANNNRVFTDDWGIQRSGPPDPAAAASQTTMVCHYVKANGFTVTYDSATKRVVLNLTLTSSKPGETAMEVTVSTSVVIRSNP